MEGTQVRKGALVGTTQDSGRRHRYSKAMGVPRSQRVLVRCPVNFTHEEGVTGDGVIFNLSLGGCAVQSPVRVSDGMLVSLRIATSEGSQPIQIEMARVRWATTNEFGVEFLMVSGKEHKKVDRFIRDRSSVQAA